MKRLGEISGSLAIGGNHVLDPREVVLDEAEAEKRLSELKRKYRLMEPAKLSAAALGKPVEALRPLRAGSKWGLPV